MDRQVGSCRFEGATIFVTGNGGSVATAPPFATDIGKGASFGRSVRFRVIALTDSMLTITAYANDVGYEVVFAEQLRSLAESGDVLVTISGSGTSPTIVRVIEAAQRIGLDVVSVAGCIWLFAIQRRSRSWRATTTLRSNPSSF